MVPPMTSSKQTKPRRVVRTLFRVGLWVAALGCAAAVVLVGLSWEAMGRGAAGERQARMERSPQYRGGTFHNAQPLWNDLAGSVSTFMNASPVTTPKAPLPVRKDTAATLATAPGKLRITWLGHSTTLIEIGGKRVLTDPVFGKYTSPIAGVGAERWYPPPVPLDAFEGVDAVLLSHDHYDHLDHPTIRRMVDWKVPFIAPLGVGAHLESWGISPERITELDWWEETKVGALRVVATPARHASGRHLLDQNHTLWASYALLADEARVFYSGDTGLFDDLSTIGERFGPFDIVMVEVGAYDAAWPDWHIGPEQAIKAHQMLRGRLFLPIHWGLFNLATHGWTEPVERVAVAAKKAGIQWAAPRPGGSVLPGAESPPKRWWPERPWRSAEESPIVSTRRGDAADRYPVP